MTRLLATATLGAFALTACAVQAPRPTVPDLHVPPLRAPSIATVHTEHTERASESAVRACLLQKPTGTVTVVTH